MKALKLSPTLAAATITLLFASCAGPGASTSEISSSRDTDNVQIVDSAVDLTEYLTQLPGVIVYGTGPYATIRVRGISTLYSGPAPLFIMDGFRMGRSYAEVYSKVNMREVKSIRLLRGADAHIYGVAGAYGVILIDTGVPAGNLGLSQQISL